MKRRDRWAALLLAAALAAGLALPAFGAERAAGETERLAGETAEWLSSSPLLPGSVGGDWAAMALARSGCFLPDSWYRGYLRRLERYVMEKQGVLDRRKSSEYSRVVLALTALGRDPADFAGYDLLSPLFDREFVTRQGINGPIYALLALDSGQYPCPEGLRQGYVEELLSRQLESGGWSLTAKDKTAAADADVTAMALQALAGYQDQPRVKAAVESGTACLGRLQGASGGFAAQGRPNAESCAQAILALCALDIDLTDPRFVKEGRTALDGLLDYRIEGGGFRHLPESAQADRMATEQAFCALTALVRREAGQPGIYQMTSDPKPVAAAAGLPEKDPAVRVPEAGEAAAFSDLPQDPLTADAVLTLAQRGILQGTGGGAFSPENPLTRAQFAALLTRALGLEGQAPAFADVRPDAWYAEAVGGASAFGLITGKTESLFDPEGPVTRQEAAVMAARAAGLCGVEDGLSGEQRRAALETLPDGDQVSAWAAEGVSLCLERGMLESGRPFGPGETMTRGEAALLLARLLEAADLI